MLRKLERLFVELDQRGVRYCHWKKNVSLAFFVFAFTGG